MDWVKVKLFFSTFVEWSMPVCFQMICCEIVSSVLCCTLWVFGSATGTVTQTKMESSYTVIRGWIPDCTTRFEMKRHQIPGSSNPSAPVARSWRSTSSWRCHHHHSINLHRLQQPAELLAWKGLPHWCSVKCKWRYRCLLTAGSRRIPPHWSPFAIITYMLYIFLWSLIFMCSNN
jgi:hypothetical protein